MTYYITILSMLAQTDKFVSTVTVIIKKYIFVYFIETIKKKP